MSYKYKENDFVVTLTFKNAKVQLNLLNLVYGAMIMRVSERTDTAVLTEMQNDEHRDLRRETLDSVVAQRGIISFVRGIEVPTLNELLNSTMASNTTNVLRRLQVEAFVDTQKFPNCTSLFQLIQVYDKRKMLRSIDYYLDYMENTYPKGYLDVGLFCFTELGKFLFDVWLRECSNIPDNATRRTKEQLAECTSEERLEEILASKNGTFPAIAYLLPFNSMLLIREKQEEKHITAFFDRMRRHARNKSSNTCVIETSEHMLTGYLIGMLLYKVDTLKELARQNNKDTLLHRANSSGAELPDIDILELTSESLRNLGIIISNEGIPIVPSSGSKLASARQYDNLSVLYQIYVLTPVLLYMLCCKYSEDVVYGMGAYSTLFDYAYTQEGYRQKQHALDMQNARLKGVVEAQQRKMRDMEKEKETANSGFTVTVDYEDEQSYEEMAEALEAAELEVVRLKRKLTKVIGDNVDDDDVIDYLDLVDNDQNTKKIEIIKQHRIALCTGIEIPRITEELGVVQYFVEKTSNMQTIMSKDTQVEYIGVYTRRIGHKANGYIKAVAKAQQATYFALHNTNFNCVVDVLYAIIMRSDKR